MTQVIIRTGAVKGFFERARKVAQKADSGEPISKSETITFESSQEKAIALSSSAGKGRGTWKKLTSKLGNCN
jgi:hypothetical protein